MLYDYVAAIEPSFLVVYALAGAAMVWLVARLFAAVSVARFALGVAVAGTVLYFVHERSRVHVLAANAGLLARLRRLEALSSTRFPHLYTEPALIDLFSSHADLRPYAPDLYDRSVAAADELLHLSARTTPGTCAADIDNARALAATSLNSFWALARNVPLAPVFRRAQQRGLRDLQSIVLELLDEMAARCGAGPSPMRGPAPLGALTGAGPY